MININSIETKFFLPAIDKNKTNSNNISSKVNHNLFFKTISQTMFDEITQNESALHLALTDMKKYIQKDKMSQFKFKFIKKELGIDENEKMSGTSYEEFCRKSFKIMLMMITQNNINFENPKNIKMSDLIEFPSMSDYIY